MRDKIVITHRIIKIEHNEKGELQFVTKGDANNTVDDKPCPADKVVGIYKFRIPKIGDFAMFLQTPVGMLLFIGVPLCAFIIYDIIRRQHSAKKADVKDAQLAAQKAEMEEKTAQMEAELERLRKLTQETAQKAEPTDENAPPDENA